MNKAQSDFIKRYQTQETLNLSDDGRNFLNWYLSDDIFRISHIMYRDCDKKLQVLIHEPIMVYEASHISFETKMAYCLSLLELSRKNILPFVIAPEIGSCHFMAGLIRKNDSGSFELFLFNPTGYSENLAKKRLGISCIDNVAGMKMIISSREIQSIQRDEIDASVKQPALVSCGPISLMFIQHLLLDHEYALALNDTFELPNSILALDNMSIKGYQERIVAERKAHFDLLATIDDQALSELEHVNYKYIQGLLEFETEEEGFKYTYFEEYENEFQEYPFYSSSSIISNGPKSDISAKKQKCIEQDESIIVQNSSELLEIHQDCGIMLEQEIDKSELHAFNSKKEKYRVLISELEQITKELIAKDDLTGLNQSKYEKAKFAAENLILKLRTYGEDFFSQAINKESIDFFENACKIEIRAAELEFKKHEGWWYNLNPILKAIIGILATITIIPALAVQCFTQNGYVETFFGKPKTEASEKINVFESHFDRFLVIELKC